MQCERCGQDLKVDGRTVECQCSGGVMHEYDDILTVECRCGMAVKHHHPDELAECLRGSGVRAERARILKLRVRRPPVLTGRSGPRTETEQVWWDIGWTAALRAYRKRIREEGT